MTYQEFQTLDLLDRVVVRTKGQEKTGTVTSWDSAIYIDWDDGSGRGMFYPIEAKHIERI